MIDDISGIRRRVRELGWKIGAPATMLVIPDKAVGDGSPHVEVSADYYCYVVTERGWEISRRVTTDVNELLYWIFSAITARMADQWELEHRIKGKDSRRLRFEKRIELLERISDEWAEIEREKIRKILAETPYDDLIDERVAYCKDLVASGLSHEQAYEHACAKYPLPG